MADVCVYASLFCFAGFYFFRMHFASAIELNAPFFVSEHFSLSRVLLGSHLESVSNRGAFSLKLGPVFWTIEPRADLGDLNQAKTIKEKSSNNLVVFPVAPGQFQRKCTIL